MLIVTGINGQTEALTDYTGISRKRRVNGDFTFSFSLISTDRNQHSYPLCEQEAVIRDKFGDEFKVKGVRKAGEFRKDIDCIHIFFDDMINAWQYDKITGSMNFVQVLNHVFSPTHWTWINQASTVSVEFDNWGDDTCLALFRTLLDRYQVEFQIDNQNKQIILKTKIGTDTDAQFRWRHNIKSYEHTIDTKNLSTIIKGFGKDGLTVTYRSQAADIYGEKHAKPIRDDRYTIAESLTQACKDTIQEVPDIQLKTDLVVLYENGLPVHSYDVGDTVYAIIDPIDLLAQIRVIEIIDNPYDKRKSPQVTLSNLKTLKKGVTSVMANFAQTQKNVNQLLDQDGNLQLSIKKLYRNSNHYSDNTGDWYIDPSDQNAYVHVGSGGIDIHRGLIRIERADGYAYIIDGIPNSEFVIQGASPPFTAPEVITEGYWWGTISTGQADCQFYTFTHRSRYLKVQVAQYASSGATSYISVEEGGAPYPITVLAVSSSTETSPTSEAGGNIITVDLGAPTGLMKSVYVRLRSDNGQMVYGRVIRMWMEG